MYIKSYGAETDFSCLIVFFFVGPVNREKKTVWVLVKLNVPHIIDPPISPPKQLITKQMRRKSRSLSLSESCKEKRKFKGTPVEMAAVAAAVAVAS